MGDMTSIQNSNASQMLDRAIGYFNAEGDKSKLADKCLELAIKKDNAEHEKDAATASLPRG